MNVFITGVSSGLGKELATKMLSEGYCVWGIARKPSNHPIIQDLRLNNNFTYTQCDQANEEDVSDLIEKIKGDKFSLNTVILNAAVMQDDFIDKQFSFSSFKEIFKINFLGTINIIDKVLPSFQQNGKGVFIGISSLAAYRSVVVNKIAYSASKSALNTAFESFRLQLANPRIRFITVNLGPLSEKKGFLSASYHQTAEKVISLLHKKKNVVDYPLIPSVIFKTLQFLPDFFISKYIIKSK